MIEKRCTQWLPTCFFVKAVTCAPVTNLSTERQNMKNLMKRLWSETEGQDLTEYALLVVLIALAAIAAMTKLGSAISNVFSNAAGNLAAT